MRAMMIFLTMILSGLPASAEMSDYLKEKLTTLGDGASFLVFEHRGGHCHHILLPQQVPLEMITDGLSYGPQDYKFEKTKIGFVFYRQYNKDGPSDPAKNGALIVVTTEEFKPMLVDYVRNFLKEKYPKIELEIGKFVKGVKSNAVYIESQLNKKDPLLLPGIKFNLVGHVDEVNLALEGLTGSTNLQWKQP